MNIHEYQAKRLLKGYGIRVLDGYLIEDPKEGEQIARRIQSDIAVVKAQVHTGGRGKAGGVKVVRTLDDAVDAIERMIGMRLVTHQTGKEGVLVRKVYIEEGCAIKKEYYLSLILDRNCGKATFIASQEGGMDIEEVAAKTPERLLTVGIEPAVGLADFQIRDMIHFMEIPEEAREDMKNTIKGIYRCYFEKDCNLIEINPLVLTEENQLVALDAKMSFDDNALYRHPEISALRDIHEEDPKEVEASKYDLSYVALEGSVACLVNGAGLAMATMDSIHDAGGTPANFLDVGGSASEENIIHAFRIIMSDSKVKGIFVNIFGGIMKCDTIARGIVRAAEGVGAHIPVVVRLEGTNEKEGKEILAQSGLEIYTADGMAEGAQMIIKLTAEGGKQNEHLGE